MKKIYTIVLSFVIILFAYWALTALPPFIEKLFFVGYNLTTESESFSTGVFAFKSSSEQPELIKAMLSLSLDFAENSPIESKTKNQSEIKNFYKLEKFFPGFNFFYATELKLTEIIFSHIPSLQKELAPLSDKDIETYFNNNEKDLSAIYGITNYLEFANLYSTIENLDTSAKFECQLEDSYFYIESKNTLKCRLILSQENNEKVYLNVTITQAYDTPEITTPRIKIYGKLGGTADA